MRQLYFKRSGWIINECEVDMTRKSIARASKLNATPQNIIFDKEQSALIVIDMQNDFCHKSGWLSNIGVNIDNLLAIVPNINAITATCRSNDIPVIWVNWGNRDDLLNLSPTVLHVYDKYGAGGGLGQKINALSDSVLIHGSWGADIHTSLIQASPDIRVSKFRMSGFWDNELDSILKNLNVKTLFFTGINTDQCVFATLMDASFIGYDCILVNDACATTSPGYCVDATTYNVQQCYGFVTSTHLLCQGLSEELTDDHL